MNRFQPGLHGTTLALILMMVYHAAWAVDVTTSNTTGINRTASTGTNTTWNTENSYWRNNYASRPYYSQTMSYSAYEPAYRYGVDLYNRNPGKRYEDLDQSQLGNGWTQARGTTTLSWDQAQAATRDAYTRMYASQAGASGSVNTGASMSGGAGMSTTSTGNTSTGSTSGMITVRPNATVNTPTTTTVTGIGTSVTTPATGSISGRARGTVGGSITR